jgi:hypothetical protein
VNQTPAEHARRAPARGKPTRAQRAVAFTFLGAFGATMLTVIMTGLWVRSPSSRRTAEVSTVALAPGEPRTIHLVFDSRTVLDDVELTVDLPAGVELVGRPGERRIVTGTALAAGSNALPLTLILRSGGGGQLAARLRQAGDQKTFVVDLTVR